MENDTESQDKYWIKYKNTSDKIVTYFDSNQLIKDIFGSEENFLFKYDSLYMLVQGFFKILKINELSNTYLHHLSDMLHSFDTLYGPNLELFIQEYDKNGKNSAIQIPENREAIKIMTGHKSKGLEFPIVILPNLDFNLDSKQARYLIEDNGYFLYTGLSEKSPIKSIANFTLYEKSQNFIDKLNLCYVMMTRPVDRLYIGNYFQKNNFGATFHKTILTMDTSFWSLDSFINEGIFIHSEKYPKSELIHFHSDTNNFTPTNYMDRLWFPDISINSEINDVDLNDARRFGNQLHDALSIIDSQYDLQEKLLGLLKEGRIEFDFYDKIEEELKIILNFKPYLELFINANKISSEQAIIIGPNETKRPDKIIFKENETIVIDFKTGLSTKKNEKQVKMYKKVLTEMEFPNVKGYLFYTKERKLQEVE